MLHFVQNSEIYKAYPFYKYLLDRAIIYTAKGVLRTATQNKLDGLAKKDLKYREGGAEFESILS